MIDRFRNGLRLFFFAATLAGASLAVASNGGGGGGGGDDDGSAELQGVVQAAPSGGLVGDWTIAGRTVHATVATVFDQSDGPIGVGAIVEVKGAAEADGSVTAAKIDVQQGVGSTPPAPGAAGGEVHFSGAIDSLPAGTLLGVWKVAGRSVTVVSTTHLEQEHGGFAVGATVEVEGSSDASGAVTAFSIELRGGGAATPVPPVASTEIHGTIDALPAGGLIGDWTVTGRKVTVTTATSLEAEHGTFAVGDPVEVKGTVQADGSLLATRIEAEDGNGGNAPALRFSGAVDALPSGANGVIGQWTVGGRTVTVTAATKVRTNDAPLVVGVTVDVEGWLQADGIVLAQEIETRAGAVAVKSGVAVEFFNAALGHFFLSANPAETALLDNGAFNGAWQRTGEAFNVGGTASVCRFYGMPPKGPDSHFFTADPAECEKVMQTLPAWTFEAHAFATTSPLGGVCPGGTVAVHRLFNNPTTVGAINHRFTTQTQTIAAMVVSGWIHEGVVMCAPQ